MALRCHTNEHFLWSGCTQQKQTLNSQNSFPTFYGDWVLVADPAVKWIKLTWQLYLFARGSAVVIILSPFNSHAVCYLAGLASSWKAGISVASRAYASACCIYASLVYGSYSTNLSTLWQCNGYVEVLRYVSIWSWFLSKRWFSVSIADTYLSKTLPVFFPSSTDVRELNGECKFSWSNI